MDLGPRVQLLSLLIGGAISVMSFVVLVVFEFPYPAGPGLILAGLAASILTGNPHGGFRTAFFDNLAVFLFNFMFYYLVSLTALIATRALRRRSDTP